MAEADLQNHWRERGIRHMNLPTSLGAGGAGSLTVLSEDGERVLCRGWRDEGHGDQTAVLAVLSASEHPRPGFVGRLAHEYALKDELDGRSTARPLALVREHGRTMLLLEDPGGEPLDQLLGRPMEMGKFLRLATGISAALCQLHERGKSGRKCPIDRYRDTSLPLFRGIQFSTRRSRAVQTAQTLVGKDADCARETRLVSDDGADHQPARLKGDRP